MISPTTAWFPSGVPYMRLACCPCGLAKPALNSASPGTCPGLMPAIFQAKSFWYPKLCWRKEATVASEGRFGVETVVAALAGGLAATCTCGVGAVFVAVGGVAVWATD